MLQANWTGYRLTLKTNLWTCLRDFPDWVHPSGKAHLNSQVKSNESTDYNQVYWYKHKHLGVMVSQRPSMWHHFWVKWIWSFSGCHPMVSHLAPVSLGKENWWVFGIFTQGGLLIYQLTHLSTPLLYGRREPWALLIEDKLSSSDMYLWPKSKLRKTDCRRTSV